MTTKTMHEVLMQFARETAADNGVDLATGIRMLDDEPSEVIDNLAAAGLTLTHEELRAWVRDHAALEGASVTARERGVQS